MADTTDLLGFAVEKNPVDFADTFNQLMQQKAQEAVSNHRVTLAQSIYGEPEETETVEDEDGDVVDTDDDSVDDDDTDFDISDDELDDFDLDDLDLNDLDLDDNEDFTDEEA